MKCLVHVYRHHDWIILFSVHSVSGLEFMIEKGKMVTGLLLPSALLAQQWVTTMVTQPH